jgi:hypothetical protein
MKEAINTKTLERGPDFVIVGAMKSGTTSVYRWLSDHSGCDFCQLKEPHFFSLNWHRGLDWYSSLYSKGAEGNITGEASQSYTHPDYSEVVAARMHKVIPDTKILYIVRHPLERMRSEYRHQVQRKRENKPFGQALLSHDCVYSRRSQYWSCIQPFVERYDPEKILVIRFEDLVSEDTGPWRDVLRFLGLGPAERSENKFNSTAGKSGFRTVTRMLYSVGLGRAENYVPSSVRKILRPLFLTNSDRFRDLMDTHHQTIPASVEADVWNDIENFESWLGRGHLWRRHETTEQGSSVRGSERC